MTTIRSIHSFILLALTALSNAALWTFDVELSGLNHVPPVVSPGTGQAFGTYDDISNLLSITVTASGVLTPFTIGHLQIAPAGATGPIGAVLLNDTPGTTWFSSDIISIPSLTEVDLLAGGVYVNLRTASRPAGELRGQIELVPEPTSIAILALGSLAVIRRRRRG